MLVQLMRDFVKTVLIQFPQVTFFDENFLGIRNGKYKNYDKSDFHVGWTKLLRALLKLRGKNTIMSKSM